MRPTDSWRKARVTAGLCILTAACWLILAVLGRDAWAELWAGFFPIRLALPPDPSLAPVWLTPLTATLVHAGFIHVAFNLVFLALLGRRVENVLGPVSLLILYLVGAYAAAGAYHAAAPYNLMPAIGAGGAVASVVGAYAILYGRNRLGRLSGRPAIWLGALWGMAAWTFIQLVLGLAVGAVPLAADALAPAAAAPAGGFLAGMLLANPLLRFRWRNA